MFLLSREISLGRGRFPPAQYHHPGCRSQVILVAALENGWGEDELVLK